VGREEDGRGRGREGMVGEREGGEVRGTGKEKLGHIFMSLRKQSYVDWVGQYKYYKVYKTTVSTCR
jgi:hypothetical protein